MDETSFEHAAETLLRDLMSRIEEARDDADVDLVGGILTIDLEEEGTYVVNLHRPDRQIWLASPMSGAWHFAPDATGKWVSTRGPERLDRLLEAELGLPAAAD
jgi:iron-sulfur cluster assembly protein CyaY